MKKNSVYRRMMSMILAIAVFLSAPGVAYAAEEMAGQPGKSRKAVYISCEMYYNIWIKREAMP